MKEDKTVLHIDPYSLVFDILRNIWIAILGAAAVTMLLTMYTEMKHTDTYSSSATFVVMSKTASNNVYSNLSAANNMANTFASIIDSDALKQMVCDDLDLASFDAQASCSIMGDTNILTLTVTSSSPQRTYNIIRSIMRNYSSLTQFVTDSMVMSVLKEPDVPTGPINGLYIRGSQKKWFEYTFLALIGVIALLSIRTDTIKSHEDLTDKLDSDALGTVYHERKKFRLKKNKQSKLLITDLNVSFSFVEEYRKIAARLVKKAGDRKVILVTSVREHEGKSTTSANIALSLAKAGKRVVLLDGDLRRPSLHQIFGIGMEDGISLPALLKGEINMNTYVRRDKDTKLVLMLNDRGYGNSTEILSSAGMQELIEGLKASCDYLVIDSPPMTSMADAEVLAGYADISVLVVQYNRVTAPEINETIDTLKEYSADFAGTVLNGVRTLRAPVNTGYGYGYGRYGRYGKYDRYGRYNRQKEKKSSEESA